jgi:hypothetical protein
MAENRWLRTGLKLIGKPGLDTYYRLHYPTVKMGLAAWDGGERDLLFHGATAVIVVAADNEASCPRKTPCWPPATCCWPPMPWGWAPA